MVDSHSLKTTWIRRLLEAGNLQFVDLVYKLMHLNNILDIEGGSSDVLKCLNHFQNTNCFWRDVLKASTQIDRNRLLLIRKIIYIFIKNGNIYI